MRLKRLIKHFRFSNDNRYRIELGDDVRLNTETHKIQLKDANGTYPLDTDLYAKTWVANPDSVRQWLGFECEVTNAKDDLGQDITGVKFRLSDGTDEYWWDGANWVVNDTDWNTEAEVANNIADFPATSKKLQVILNPYTTDETETPEIDAVKVLYSSNVEHQEDYVYRTIVRQLREQVRPISDFPVRIRSATTTIDMKNDYKLETPYNVVGIDACFNHTDDPDHFTDLYQSFDPNTQIITLNTSIDVNKVLWIRFIWEPEVAVTTGQEYHEVAKVPALILSDVNLTNSAESGQDDWVINKSNRSAVKVPAPLQADIEVVLNGLTDSARDQVRLADELKRFFRNNPTITSKGLDEMFRLWLIEEYNGQTEANIAEIHAGRLRFLLVKALFFEREAVDVFAVERMRLTGDMNAVIS
jgi:hypothetical protein